MIDAPPAARATTGGDAALLRRVRWRLLLWSGGSTLVVLVVLGILLYGAVANSLAAESESQLLGRARALASIVGARVPAVFPNDGAFTVNVTGAGIAIGGPASGSLALIVAPDGSVLGPPELAILRLGDADLATAQAGQQVVRTTSLAGTPVRVVAVPVDRIDGRWVVQVAADRLEEERTLGVLVTVLAAGGLVALLVALLVGNVYADRALVPIRDSMRRQREFAADASHELRTPLAIVRGSVEHLRRHAAQPVASVGDALDDIESETARLTALVEDLLTLARTDSGALDLARVPTDLAEVVLDASGPLAGVAQGKGVHLEVDARPCPMDGDPGRLRQLATVLVDNAIRHAPSGSTVRVAVGPAGDGAALRVEDEGPGIRAQDLPRIFDRFWRAPDAPPGGTGLGLSIAAWVVERHGGSIVPGNRPGGGARFDVRLPAH